METVIKGIGVTKKSYNPEDDIVKDISNVKLMNTLFSHKRLKDADRSLQEIVERI
jgi:hypothetical protein